VEKNKVTFLKEKMTKKSVYKKSEELALEIMAITKEIKDVKKDYYMADQIFRSSTSVAANLREAKFANTDKMYLHKLSISIREADETNYWISVMKFKDYNNPRSARRIIK
jgi:four helix bundle protein